MPFKGIIITPLNEFHHLMYLWFSHLFPSYRIAESLKSKIRDLSPSRPHSPNSSPKIKPKYDKKPKKDLSRTPVSTCLSSNGNNNEDIKTNNIEHKNE